MFAARSVARFVNFGGNRFSLSMSRMSSVSYTLSFDTYDAYGFDIDHTLAKYNLPHLFTVCFRLTLMTNIGINTMEWSRMSTSFINIISCSHGSLTVLPAEHYSPWAACCMVYCISRVL